MNALTGDAQVLNESILYSFTNSPDGSYPVGGVILGKDGSLYGTTSFGGVTNRGTLYQINRNGSGYQVLHLFDFDTGSSPTRLLQGTNGFLFGTAGNGGSNGVGAVFTIDTNGTGYAQLHAFSNSDGAFPSSGALFQGSNGLLYGIASQGGISNAGTLFQMNPDGSAFQLLHQFTNSPDGAVPASVILGNDGLLYGATASGGISNAGVVFRVTTNGDNYAILHTFTKSPDGSQPQANLIQGKDGMLYGTTVFGGTAFDFGGVLFKVNTDGSGYTVLHNFPSVAGDGINPDSLIQASDGWLYGVAANGGAFSAGMVFRVDTNGNNYTVAYGFTNSPPDGRNPVAPLIEAGDGALYGTADHGGIYDQGTVFRLAPPLILSLKASTVGGTNIAVLSWPAWASDFGVATAPTLKSNAIWTALSAPILSGGKLFATNRSFGSNAFFRLQSPP